MKNPHRDWTRLLPKKKGPETIQSRQDRFTYLFEFIRHKKGSKSANQKAFKEMETLCQGYNQ